MVRTVLACPALAAPWCGHCKHLVPEYKKLGSLIAVRKQRLADAVSPALGLVVRTPDATLCGVMLCRPTPSSAAVSSSPRYACSAHPDALCSRTRSTVTVHKAECHPVRVPQVDADAHRSLGEKFDVKGFPTIKFFSRGKAASKDTMKE